MTSTRAALSFRRTHRRPARALRGLALLAVLLATLVAVPGGAAQAALPPGWSGPVQVDPAHGGATALSCPTSTFCAAVDQKGDAFVMTGSSWSAPARIETTSLGDPVPQVDVSCASPTFCVSVDDWGHAIGYDGSRWSAPVTIDGDTPLDSVSCPSSGFCVAVDSFGYAMTFNGHAWGSPVLVDPGKAGGERLVSCSSASFCALMSSGSVRTFDGSTWSTTTTIGLGPILYAISCTSASFCLAEGANGFSGPGVVRFDGTTWTTPSGTGGGTDVSCTSATFCVAVNAGAVSTFNGTSWTAPTALAYGLTSVSCASSTSCATIGTTPTYAIGSRNVQTTGAVYTYDGAAWSSPVPVDPAGGGPGAVSCPAVASCVAVFPGMDASTYQDGTWAYRTYIDDSDLSENAGPVVSCPTTTFCAAVGFAGDALTWNGTTWSTTVGVAAGLVSVSCPTATFCVAVTGSGDVVTYHGSGWSLPTKIDADWGLSSVSCATPTFCVAVDERVNVLTYDGTGWSTPASVGMSGGWPGAVSCASPTFCAVTSKAGAVTFHGAGWTAPTLDGAGTAVSCVSATFCLSVGLQKASVYDGTTWSAPVAVVPSGIGVGLHAVSCASTSSCLVLTTAGTAYAFGGTTAPDAVRTAGPTVTGTPRVGHTLTCSVAYTGARTISYGWTRNGVSIPGATASSYRLTARDAKARIGCRTQAVGLSGAQTAVASSRTVLISLDALTNRGRPTILGKVKARRTVHAGPGSWSPAATSFAYQWLLGGRPIRGATRATFKITRGCRHHRLSVRVTAHRGGYADGVATSRQTKVR
jgi:hypothetical protein